jgi:two-component system sensor histidine kinase BarA
MFLSAGQSSVYNDHARLRAAWRTNNEITGIRSKGMTRITGKVRRLAKHLPNSCPLVPLIIAVLLGIYLVNQQLASLDAVAAERGQRDAAQLAMLLANLTANTSPEFYQQLAEDFSKQAGLQTVELLNRHNAVLARASLPSPSPAVGISIPGGKQALVFHTPVPGTNDDQGVHGILTYDYRPVATEKFRILLISVMTFILALFIATLAIAVNNKRLRTSLENIGKGLDDIDENTVTEPVVADFSTETVKLADRLNKTTERVRLRELEAERQVSQATEDLTETLETVEIQNIELDIARREAVEANEIKSRFLANTTHEIRTPLNGIIGFTKLLLKSPMNRSQYDYLNTIKNSAEGLLAIVNDILDLSRIEAGKLTLDPVETALHPLVENTLDILAPDAHQKVLELALNIDRQVPARIVCDPLRLQQILTNLVSNAIKFTRRGHINVEVALEQERESETILKFTVTDTGCGLNEQQQKNLFRAFAQVDNSVSREHYGTGLGLVISKYLAEQMGGDIGLESETGKGSSFWFTIKSPTAVHASAPHMPDLCGRELAVIENSVPARRAIASLLANTSASVTVLNDLDELQAQCGKNSKPDTIILGLSADLLDEAEILALIDRVDRVSKYPPIVLAPLDSPAITNRKTDSRALVINKPATSGRLYPALQELFTGKPGGERLDESTLASIQPARILAVDDNPANLKLLAILLEDFGARVQTASNGQQALELSHLHPFDLIFMDVQMPGMDGVETTRQIRASKSINTNTPVIALTAHALADEKRRLLMAGMNDHLSKPITESLIGEMVRKWCTNNRDDAGGDEITVQPVTVKSIHTRTEFSKPVDIALCLELANRRNDLAEEMLTGLLNELDTNKQRIEHNYHDKNYPDLLENIHYLHGICCYTGVPQLKNATQSAESALKEKDWDSLPARIKQVDTEMARLQEWRDEHEVTVLFGN